MWAADRSAGVMAVSIPTSDATQLSSPASTSSLTWDSPQLLGQYYSNARLSEFEPEPEPLLEPFMSNRQVLPSQLFTFTNPNIWLNEDYGNGAGADLGWLQHPPMEIVTSAHEGPGFTAFK